MKTDKELDAAIFEKEAKRIALAKDGWTRLINQGKAAYTKNGEYRDLKGNPCEGPVKPKKPRKTTPKPVVEEVEPTDLLTDPEPPEAA